jgi:hypothetical protein
MISAIDVGPVAAPPSAARTRKRMSDGAFHASAHVVVRTVNAANPVR